MPAGSIIAAALVSGLVVESGSPDALCPDLSTTEEAISARVGELRSTGNSGWRVRYTIAHAPDDSKGDFVHLELYDPDNELRLARDLPFGDEGCAAMSQVIALIVDRFFRTLKDVSTPAPNAAFDARVAVDPERPARAESRTGTPTPNAARPPVLWLEAGVVSHPLRPTAGLSLWEPLATRLSLNVGLKGVLVPAREAAPDGGEARLITGLLRVHPSWDVALGAGRIGLGPTLSLALERGSATGIDESDAKYRALAGLGAATALAYPLVHGLWIGWTGGIEVPFRPLGGRFIVQEREVLKPPHVRILTEIAIGAALFR